MTPCSLLSVYLRFRLTFCLYNATGSSEGSSNMYQITRRDINRMIFNVTFCDVVFSRKMHVLYSAFSKECEWRGRFRDKFSGFYAHDNINCCHRTWSLIIRLLIRTADDKKRGWSVMSCCFVLYFPDSRRNSDHISAIQCSLVCYPWFWLPAQRWVRKMMILCASLLSVCVRVKPVKHVNAVSCNFISSYWGRFTVTGLKDFSSY